MSRLRSRVESQRRDQLRHLLAHPIPSLAPLPFFEADLVKIKGLLHDWKVLWDKATPQERQDIVAALFGEVRVRDKNIVSATLADPRYAPLIASSEARRLRLVTPAEDEEEQVGLASPDGRGALTAKPEEKLAAYL